MSVVKEEFDVVASFVGHHLKLGIDDIIIFFDGSEAVELCDYLDRRFGGIGYSVFALTDVAEIRQHLRPQKDFGPIQNSINQHAQKLAKYPWIITLDADEYLFAPGVSAEALELLPEQTKSVRFPVAEAVWIPGDDPWSPFGSSGFRIPFKFRSSKAVPRKLQRLLTRLVYLRDASFFPDNVIGHGNGRHAYRRDADFEYIGPHSATVGGKSVSVRATKVNRKLEEVFVLHYDAISFQRWQTKISRRAGGQMIAPNVRPERSKLFEKFRDYGGDRESSGTTRQQKLFLRMYRLNMYQYFLLKAFRSVFKTRGIHEF